MIVRDAGEAWQIVLQTDHADLSGDFARAWAEPTRLSASLELAGERHDDGWAVWEQAPRIDAESAKPVTFLDVAVPVHIAFYRACIAAVTEADPYAGLLISMHGSGIYSQRYGRDPGLPRTYPDGVQQQVDAFVAEQEATHGERAAQAGASEEERWRDYELLQLYDRLSLYFCMRDVEAGESAELQGYKLEPVGPWRIRIDPYPFAEQPARFELLRRVLPKRGWRSQDDFQAEFSETEPERKPLTIEP